MSSDGKIYVQHLLVLILWNAIKRSEEKWVYAETVSEGYVTRQPIPRKQSLK